MPSLTRSERAMRSALMTAVAVVSVVAISLGYHQQMASSVLRQEIALPPEAEFLPEELVEPDEQIGLNEESEPIVWCCNGDVGLCYEQPQASGCEKDASSDDFEACAIDCQK